MKKGLWIRDGLIGLAVCTLIIGLNYSGAFSNLERIAYDMGVSASSHIASKEIAVIAIDDQSIAKLGPWPWPRDKHARLHDILKKNGVKNIVQTSFFFEPQATKALKTIEDLEDFVNNSSLSGDFTKFSRRLPKHLKSLNSDLGQLKQKFQQAKSDLNTDAILSRSIRDAANVILAMRFNIGTPLSKAGKPLPNYVQTNALTHITNDTEKNSQGYQPLAAKQVLYPIPQVAYSAAGVGALNNSPDVDGVIRIEPLVINYYSDFYPSLSLLTAAHSLNLTVDDIRVSLGEGIELGNLKINTNARLQMNTFYYQGQNGQTPFVVDSFYDILEGKIAASKYRGKTVLIGATATGIGNNMMTPIDASMPPVLSLAHSVSSILNEDFFVEPSWSNLAQWLIFLLLILYICLLLPRLSAAVSMTISLLLLAGLLSAQILLMTQYGLWLQLMAATMLLLSGHIVITSKAYFLSERGRQQLHDESAESNRMLGLSLQGQGQLDAAFDKFRKLPANKESLDVLYNLALDFERKRQANKAVSVYRYILEIDNKFRDTQDRLNRAQSADENLNVGSSQVASKSPVAQNTSGTEKSMLGRYEIEKEIGKGAMGAVYLGKDTKIGRVVAIKTMALSQEFEGDELRDVKDRFFREAETAGRLSHPNIVTIYDAGEDHDLAYIAMEFIKGSDILQYCKADALLPVERVMSIIMRAADALSFAHKQNVVHRDIKPANLMYDNDTDTLKITDFGIARITDSSKTKTGMVLGTPSYMSPEQLAGKKVDGRSDLFSLGVMMFQMLTGRLPFQGESMAALMYKIANEAHPSPDSIRPELHRSTGIIINRAMAKDRDKRYKSGEHMANDCRKCMQIMAKAKKA